MRQLSLFDRPALVLTGRMKLLLGDAFQVRETGWRLREEATA